MKRIWHYIKDGEFPPCECACLCRIKWGYIFVTANYFGEGDWCSMESGDRITDSIEAWADLNEVLERVGLF